MKKESLIRLTKYFLDFMFFGGIVTTATVPLILKLLGNYLDRVAIHYRELILIYFVLGVAAVAILRELRKIFKTVMNKDCFVKSNVESLNKMCRWSFFIVLMSAVRSVLYFTMAIAVIILVFIVAGLFSKVLAYVFEEAVGYKEENDFTI